MSLASTQALEAHVKKKIKLTKTELKSLTPDELQAVAGGMGLPTSN